VIAGEDLKHILEHTRPLWEALRGERIFMTGGTGFVGSWLTASLLHANRELGLGIRAVLLTRRPEIAAARMCELGADDAIELRAGDACSFVFPPGRFACVIHAATTRAFAPNAAQPLGIFEADVTATRRVLDFASSSGTSRMLFTSSGAVYGRQPPELPRLNEDFSGAPSPTDVAAVYGHSKRTSEFLCAMYARTYGISIPIARLFAFVGPLLPLDEGYAAGNFIADELAGRAIRIAGDGTPVRSYLYAADLAIWLWTILLAGRSGRAYNTGARDALSIGELARAVAGEAGANGSVTTALPPPDASAARYVPDTSRAENELGLRARIPLREGIRRTLSWHRRRSLTVIRSLG
jgi:dTDP-glucose 4,6-dehydratase